MFAFPRKLFNKIYKKTIMESNKFYEISPFINYEFKKPEKLFLNIGLEEKETQIFEIIKKVLKKHNKTTVCRVAGGWVRDKVNTFLIYY